MANEQNGTMREHMNALTSYRPPNADGSFPPPQPPPGMFPGATTAVGGGVVPIQGFSPGGGVFIDGRPPSDFQAGYPPGVQPVTQYLPPGTTQLEQPPQAQFAPPQAQPQQPQQPPQGQPQFAPPAQIAPFYQDPQTGFLRDLATREYVSAAHPAYAYPDSYRQYLVAAPALEQQAPQAGFPTMPASAMPQQPPQQYPNYSPHSGPNAPEQHEDPSLIPPPIATPALAVAGTEETPTGRRKRRTKAEIEAAKAAAGGTTAQAMQHAAVGGDDSASGEELAFVHALQGVFSNPQMNLGAVTVAQLKYVGDLARQAYRESFLSAGAAE